MDTPLFSEDFMQYSKDNHYFLLADGIDNTNSLALFMPKTWQKAQRIIGHARGRGVTWFIGTQDLWDMNVALRHYYRGGLWGKFNKDLYYSKDVALSRSFMEFNLLQKLHQQGLAVPRPIAAHVHKVGWGFYRADLISELIEDAQDLTAVLQEQSLNAQQWQEIGALVKKLHKNQVCHTDLNAHNILLQHANTPNEKFYLIDFDKCSERLGDDWKKDNLARLRRSFLKEVNRMHIHFDDACWQNLLAGYDVN